MIAIDLISEIVPAIHKKDTGGNALNWMEVFKVSHLPIVDNDKYLGLISDADIFDLNTPDCPVLDHCLSLRRPFVYENQHIFECIDLASKLKLSVVPVLSIDEQYIGIIRVIDLAHTFSTIMSTDNPGGIVVLEMNNYDYSLSEISQIIESNNVKILSLYVQTILESEKLEITLKLNRTDLSAVIQTFERYNYNIKAIYGDHKEVDMMLQNRVDSLFKYFDL